MRLALAIAVMIVSMMLVPEPSIGGPYPQLVSTRYEEGAKIPAEFARPVRSWDFVAREKLESMGIHIDTLTAEQQRYMTGWEQGT